MQRQIKTCNHIITCIWDDDDYQGLDDDSMGLIEQAMSDVRKSSEERAHWLDKDGNGLTYELENLPSSASPKDINLQYTESGLRLLVDPRISEFLTDADLQDVRHGYENYINWERRTSGLRHRLDIYERLQLSPVALPTDHHTT